MSSRNRIATVTVTVFVVLAMGIGAYFILRQPIVSSRSLLLYTNYQSPETITNWIVDTDTGEKWEVGKGLAAWHWSPSGKYLMFYTLSPLPRQIWISDFDGSNLRKVLDNQDYPEFEIKDFDWLSDETIIVNVVKGTQAFAYLLKINTLSFEQIPNSTSFVHLSPNGQFWVEFDLQNKYSLFDTDGKRAFLSLNYWHHYFSPSGNQVAYSCAGKDKFSSLCLAEISLTGITNEYKLAEDVLVNAFGDIWWSQDGKYVGFLHSPDKNETRFRVIDVSNGSIVYERVFPTKDTRIFWSPHGDKIIDWGGLLLDLKTGQVSNFFAEIGETTPSYVVDWRMIEMP